MAGKTQFSLNPNPTFDVPVFIPAPGQEPKPLVFTFKHMDRQKFSDFLKSLDAAMFNSGDEKLDEINIDSVIEVDVGFVMQIASGWELKDEFNEENIRILLRNYFAASRTIVRTFIDALTVAKEKN